VLVLCFGRYVPFILSGKPFQNCGYGYIRRIKDSQAGDFLDKVAINLFVQLHFQPITQFLQYQPLQNDRAVFEDESQDFIARLTHTLLLKTQIRVSIVES
jgi:hypothetical protein